MSSHVMTLHSLLGLKYECLENQMQWSMQVISFTLLSNTQLTRFQALPFASVSPSVLIKSGLEGDISSIFPLFAVVFTFHILKTKSICQNLGRGLFPKLTAGSQTLLQRCSAASHWDAHLCPSPAGRVVLGSVGQVYIKVSTKAPRGWYGACRGGFSTVVPLSAKLHPLTSEMLE